MRNLFWARLRLWLAIGRRNPNVYLAISFGLCERGGVTSVAERIEAVRTSKGWTYRELGEQLEVSVSTAHGWASGKIEPNLINLRRIAKRLRIGLASLVGAS